jgi:hypothetical protein
MSLLLQWAFPERGITLHYGHEQLFVRGFVQGCGIPLYLARGIQKISDLSGTEWERSSVEIAINFIRALTVVPIQTWSLLHQWRYTGRAADEAGRYDAKDAAKTDIETPKYKASLESTCGEAKPDAESISNEVKADPEVTGSVAMGLKVET